MSDKMIVRANNKIKISKIKHKKDKNVRRKMRKLKEWKGFVLTLWRAPLYRVYRIMSGLKNFLRPRIGSQGRQN